MVALGVAIVVIWGVWQARKKDSKFNGDQALMAALVGIPSGVIFSKLLHVIDNIVVAKFHPEIAASGGVIDYTIFPMQIFSGNGLSIEGAVLGAALGIWIYSRYSKLNYGAFVDAITPSIILAQAVGRIGCTINGCCFGLPTNLPWAVAYTNLASEAGNMLGIGVHPTQVYEIIFDLIVFGILLALRKKFKPEGSLFAIYLSFYAAWRIGIDFIRDGNPFLFSLHQAQVVGIVILLVTVPFLIIKTRLISKDKQAVPEQNTNE
ncbi:MAG: prolipoprotein diacylglyceryl transferase [Dehalococcoidales bacterium]|nr:prolipoprotein diacylglyceryl transferase [Dehalococcoidales bacterium]